MSTAGMANPTMTTSSSLPSGSTPTSTSTSSPGTLGSAATSTTMAAIQEAVKSIVTTATSAITSITGSTTTTTTTTTTAIPLKSSTTTTTTTSAAASSPSDTTTPEMMDVDDLSHSLQHFGYTDYFVFILMLVVSALIGFYFGFIEKKKKKRNMAERRGSEALDYLVGGRKMKVFPVSMSLVASFVSGISLLGTSTEIYVYGTQYAFILVTLVLSGIISWYVFLPVFCNLQLTSTYEYLERRFSHRMRLFGAALFIIKSVLWMPIAIYVPALTFNQVSGVNIHNISPIVIIICTFYTTVGGIKGVVWTDVIQTILMFGSLIVLMIKGTIDMGGLGVVWQRNMDGGRLGFPELTLDPTVRMGFFAVFVGGTFFKLQNTSINQPTIQRFMSLPSLDKIKRCLIYFVIGLCCLLGSCVYVGLLTFARYYDCDPMSTGLARARDQLVPLLVMDILGVFPGLPGLFVSGVFSAALSSLSTFLNSLAAVVLEDFVKPNVKKQLSERSTAIWMRMVVVVCGLSSIGLVYVVEHLGMVLQLSATMQAILYGPILGIFTTGMLMPWINEKSVLAGGTVSVLCMAWICINAQVATVTGSFRHAKLPVSIEGCDYEFDMHRYMNSTSEYEPSKGSKIYHVSFLYYTMLGGIITIIASNIAILVFGTNDVSKMDKNLFSPFVTRFLKKEKYQSVDLNEKIEILEKKILQ